MSLDKETRQRKRLWRELDDESSADESLDESSISIKGEIRSENTELELTSDFSNLRCCSADAVLIFLEMNPKHEICTRAQNVRENC